MLYQVSNEWKCGFIEDFIEFSENGCHINSKIVKVSNTKVFKYEIKSLLPPGIVRINNKTFITPGWVPCHPKTKLSDIIWIKKTLQEKEENKEIDTWRFKSSSGDGEYVTKKNGFKYTCNCPGYWRSKDRECKHIKEVKSYNK